MNIYRKFLIVFIFIIIVFGLRSIGNAQTPTASISFDPPIITAGGTTTITWSSNNPTSCVIPSGASSCDVNFSWNTINPQGTSAITKPVNVTVATGNSGTDVPLTVKYNSETFYLYNNAVLLNQYTVTSSCASGNSWDGVKCATAILPINGVCSATHYNCSTGTSALNVDGATSYTWMCNGLNGGTNASCSENKTLMSGTLTRGAPSCTIASGASTCNINFSWTTTNPIATSSVTKPVNITVANGNSGTNVPFAVKHNSETFYLYNNAQLLAQSTVTSSCVGGTEWDGSSCSVAPPACTTGYLDYDKDGYGAGAQDCYVASSSYDIVANNNDCDDTVVGRWIGTQRSMYQSQAKTCGTACASETQTCQAGGVWSGTFTESSCSVSSRQMYQTDVVCGGTCSSEAQTCQTNGNWSGSYTYSSCSSTLGTTGYKDYDKDGYGAGAQGCYTTSSSYNIVANASDCNDGNASYNTGNCISGSLTGGTGAQGTTIAGGGFTYSQYTSNSNATVIASSISGLPSGVTCYNYPDCGPSTYYNVTTGSTVSHPIDFIISSSATVGIYNISITISTGSESKVFNGTLTITAPLITYYRDADGDGYGNPAVSTQATSQPAGYVANNTDCGDSNCIYGLNCASIYPGSSAGAYANVDFNCDGSVTKMSAYSPLNNGTLFYTAGSCVSNAWGYTGTPGNCSAYGTDWRATSLGSSWTCSYSLSTCAGVTNAATANNTYYTSSACTTSYSGFCGTYCIAMCQ